MKIDETGLERMRKLKKPEQNEGNVFLFPNLPARLLQKAMGLVEEKKYKEARRLFGKLLDLDSQNQKGLYGWTICSIELGDYASAEETITRLMNEKTPHFTEIFRLYLTLLIEKKDYKNALWEIKKAEGDPELRKMSEFLSHMKSFCLSRLDEMPAVAPSTNQQKNEFEKSLLKHPTVDLSTLESHDPESRMLLIRHLTDTLNQEDLPEIQRFLLEENQSQEIKTMLLCAIQENHLAETVAIRKFGDVYHVAFDQQFLNRATAERIEQTINQVLGSENPTLAELAIQLSRFFMVNIFPKPITTASEQAWASFFVVRAAGVDQMVEEKQYFLNLFAVSEDAYERARETALEAEQYPDWPDD